MASAPGQQEMMKSSNFARTCNRFSQFLKQRRSQHQLGDVIVSSPALEMSSLLSPYPTTSVDNNTMDLDLDLDLDLGLERKSLELFPLTSSSTGNSSQENTQNMTDSSESSRLSMEEAKKTKASMTIIYDGKVVVLDEMTDEMAKEIMSLAASAAVITPRHETPQITNNNNAITTSFVQGLSDLPLARRVSLHRFMEKRKERISATAPYQVPSSMSNTHAHLEKYNSKKSFKQQEEQQLELKL